MRDGHARYAHRHRDARQQAFLLMAKAPMKRKALMLIFLVGYRSRAFSDTAYAATMTHRDDFFISARRFIIDINDAESYFIAGFGES